MPVGLFFLYPLWAHITVLLDAPAFACWWLVAALFSLAWSEARRLRGSFALVTRGAALLLVAMVWHGHSLAPLYLQPFIVCSAFLIAFGRSLLPGETPLVTVFAQALGDHIDRQTAAYTRAVTKLWTGVFGLMLIKLVALGLWADTTTWSLFANVVNYLLVLVVFAAEFRARVARFGRERSPSFSRFLISLARLRWKGANVGLPR